MDSTESTVPDVTVVLPVYNGAEFVREAVASVQAQTLGSWELVVVDDGSTDASMRIVAETAGGDIRVVTLQQTNRGQSAARNAGVERARGRYLAFLDQDDRYAPDRLQRAIDFLDSRPDVGMVYMDVDLIDREGRVLVRNALSSGNPPIPPRPHPKTSLQQCLEADMFIVPGTATMRREVFAQAGGFDENLSGYEDDDLFLRVFQRARIDFIPDTGLSWRLFQESSSYSSRMDRSRLQYFRKLCSTFPDQPRLNLYWVQDVIAPRFCITYAAEIVRSRRLQDFDRVARLVSDFEELHPRPWWTGPLILVARFLPPALLRPLRNMTVVFRKWTR